MKRTTVIITAIVVAVVGSGAAIFYVHGASERVLPEKKQLLVYCGVTLIKPMSEIGRIIEEEENCEVIITKGGSGNLLRAIQANQVGDLYLPGSESYIETCREEGLVTETTHVGYNKAAIMVQKGNPKNISNDLINLTKPEYCVVIGNPSSGSIGRETRNILEKRGIFEQVTANALKLTTDSKDLVAVLRDKEADIVINWYATSTWENNKSYVDVLPIDHPYATKEKLVLGVLKHSSQPGIARKFLDYAASAKGQAIFNKYGLFNVE